MNTHGLQRHHATATKVAGIRHSLPVSIPARAMRPGRVVPRPLGQVLTIPSRHPATVVETAVVQPDHRIRLARTLEAFSLDRGDELAFTIETDRVVLAPADHETPASRRLRVGTRAQVTLTVALRHALDVDPGASTTAVVAPGGREAWLVASGTVAAGVDVVAATSPAALDLARSLPELTRDGADVLLSVAARLSPAQLARLASVDPDHLDDLLQQPSADAAEHEA